MCFSERSRPDSVKKRLNTRAMAGPLVHNCFKPNAESAAQTTLSCTETYCAHESICSDYERQWAKQTSLFHATGDVHTFKETAPESYPVLVVCVQNLQCTNDI